MFTALLGFYRWKTLGARQARDGGRGRLLRQPLLEDRVALLAPWASATRTSSTWPKTAAFFNMANRMASATDMVPNPEYHKLDR
jgi:hypothetical protein